MKPGFDAATIDACIKLIESMPENTDQLPIEPVDAYERGIEDALFQLLAWRGRVGVAQLKERS